MFLCREQSDGDPLSSGLTAVLSAGLSNTFGAAVPGLRPRGCRRICAELTRNMIRRGHQNWLNDFPKGTGTGAF